MPLRFKADSGSISHENMPGQFKGEAGSKLSIVCSCSGYSSALRVVSYIITQVKCPGKWTLVCWGVGRKDILEGKEEEGKERERKGGGRERAFFVQARAGRRRSNKRAKDRAARRRSMKEPKVKRSEEEGPEEEGEGEGPKREPDCLSQTSPDSH